MALNEMVFHLTLAATNKKLPACSRMIAKLSRSEFTDGADGHRARVVSTRALLLIPL